MNLIVRLIALAVIAACASTARANPSSSLAVHVNVTVLPAPVRCTSAWNAAGMPVADCREVRAGVAASDASAEPSAAEARRLAPATSAQRLSHRGTEYVGLTVAW